MASTDIPRGRAVPLVFLFHIVAGSIGIISGFLALFTAKGAARHRRTGMIFVFSMLTMSVAALALVILLNSSPAVNGSAAVLTAYLVITGLTTVKPLSWRPNAVTIGGMAIIAALVLMDFKFGAEAIANGGKRDGIPAFPFLMFGSVAFLALIGDYRMLRSGPLVGARRLARHLWRMCYALFIAALSFFIGQAKVIPKPIRIFPLLVMPVATVLVAMLYWMWRIRIRQSLRGIMVHRDTPVTPPVSV